MHKFFIFLLFILFGIAYVQISVGSLYLAFKNRSNLYTSWMHSLHLLNEWFRYIKVVPTKVCLQSN